MKTIFFTSLMSLLSFACLSQESVVQPTDFVIEVQLSDDNKIDNLNLRYADLVSSKGNVIVVKTSKDKSSFAKKELEKKFPSAKLNLMPAEIYLNRTKKSGK